MASIQLILNKITDLASRTGKFSIAKEDFFQLLRDIANKISEVLDNTNAVAKQLEWCEPVATVADLTIAYGNTTKGLAAMVTTPWTDGVSYVYSCNGTKWNRTGLTAFPGDVAVKSDIFNLKRGTGKNLFNKNTNIKIGFVTTNGDVGGNLDYRIGRAYWENINSSIVLTKAIMGGGTFGLNYYDISGVKIKTITQQSKVIPYFAGTDYIEFSFELNDIDFVQAEYGTTPTAYSEYVEKITPSLLPESLTINEQRITTTETNIAKMLLGVGKNLFNNKQNISVGFIDTTGGVGNNPDYRIGRAYWRNVLSSITLSGGINIGQGIFGLNYRNVDGEIIKTVSQMGYTVPYFKETDYIEFSFLLTDIDLAQVEYGIIATTYEKYAIKITPSLLPDTVLDTSGRERIILPNRLYFKMGKSYSLYYRNFIFQPQKQGLAKPIFMYGANLLRQWNYLVGFTGEFQMPIDLRKDLKLIQYIAVNYTSLDTTLNNGKTKNVLCIGDSFTDIGTYVNEIKVLLNADGVIVNQIGTMGMLNYRHEALSGGSMSNFILAPFNPSRILTVSGIVIEPVTGYPGTQYTDSNGTIWKVTGMKLVGGVGRIKVSTLTTTIVNDMPANGILTKINNGLAGDVTITYTAKENVFQNPFWNPATGLLDFQYYITKWGFNAPDVFVLQFGYNDLGPWADSIRVASVVANAKTIIDKAHSDYPNAKVIYSIQPPGSENNASGDTDAMLFSILSFAEAMFIQFEQNLAYNSFVFIAPSYAFVDCVNGFTAYNITPNSRYPTVIETYGGDGTHPADAGMRQIADCIHPIISAII